VLLLVRDRESRLRRLRRVDTCSILLRALRTRASAEAGNGGAFRVLAVDAIVALLHVLSAHGRDSFHAIIPTCSSFADRKFGWKVRLSGVVPLLTGAVLDARDSHDSCATLPVLDFFSRILDSRESLLSPSSLISED
jgi:hypothetical protein